MTFKGLTRCTTFTHDFYQYFLDKYKPTMIEEENSFTSGLLLNSSVVYFVADMDCTVKFRPQPRGGQQYIFGECDVTVELNYLKNGDIIKPLLEDMKTFARKDIKAANPIRLIVESKGELTTKSFNIKLDDIDVGLHYGESFVPIYDKIFTRLNKSDDKGIVLLHGEPGTGKTSLIKYITKHLNKEVLFVPPSMSTALCSPGFLPFLLQHPNCILVIEDAERVILDRDTMGTSGDGVSNILNVSDGILGDCLNIQIVATFNTKKDKIDQALLRKGRLIAEYEFKALSPSDANRLLKHLGKDHHTLTPMKLTDIYNLEEVEYRGKNERVAVGFKY